MVKVEGRDEWVCLAEASAASALAGAMGMKAERYDHALVRRTPDGAAVLALYRGELSYGEVLRSALDALSGRSPSTPRMTVLSEP